MRGRPKPDASLSGPLIVKLFMVQDKLEWSMKRYAEKSGLAYRKLCRIRQGKQEPTLYDLILMAAPFGLTITLGELDD